MLTLYSAAMGAGTPLIRKVLLRRSRIGKEDPARLAERMGIYNKQRPAGPLAWFHAASVGEAQSTLILINALQKQTPFQNILVTTGTLTSAKLMEDRLPPGAFHQFFPVDHPQWTKNFLNHWNPDVILWMESELWPNMLLE
ncbi:MAG: 3-deoxy-D-manno-octulosonic acid transferase, partial [Proteobacteria bacterium]|nr:3-deoxy-D-manno-octulosonic acid transferase [Pseudomonadota bacterium]